MHKNPQYISETQILTIIGAVEAAQQAALDEIRCDYDSIIEKDEVDRDYILDAPERFAVILCRLDQWYDEATGCSVKQVMK